MTIIRAPDLQPDPVERLLAGELTRGEREQLRPSLTGPDGCLYGHLRQRVIARDTERLHELCYTTTPIHRLLAAAAADDELPAPDTAPNVEDELPTVHALRAQAALGLALVVATEDETVAHLEVAFAWFRRANAAVGGAPDGLPREVAAPDDRIARLAARYGATEPAWQAVELFLRALAGDLPPTHGPSLQVLLDHGSAGGCRATLRVALLPGGPGGLVADPRTFGFFSGDEGFRQAGEDAWAQTGHGIGGDTVLWSLERADGDPVHRVVGGSLGAAFAILLDELERSTRRRSIRVRRLQEGTAVIGRIDEHGRMCETGGYVNKVAALRRGQRVILPTFDEPVVRRFRDQTGGPQIVTASTWQDAARVARTLDQRTKQRMLKVGALVAIVALVAGAGLFAWDQRIREVREIAERVADRATELSAGDAGGLGLLLAMASDDIAARTGATTSTFEDLARHQATLVRILRPPSGEYRDAAVSRTGEVAALSTSAGTVQVVSTDDGSVQWQRDHPPGLELSPEQTRIAAVAVSPNGDHVAFATSDLTLTLLERSTNGWREVATVALPVADTRTGLLTRLNGVDSLDFGPEGETLVAGGSRIGIFWYDVDSFSDSPDRCALVAAPALVPASDSALLIGESEVVRISRADCGTDTELNAPAGVTLTDATVDETEVIAVGAAGAQLLALRANAPPAVIADRGPYLDAQMFRGDGALQVTARDTGGTYGWRVEDGAQTFGYPRSGSAVYNGARNVWIHDGIAELHDAQRTPASVRSFDAPAAVSLAWAGSDLVVRQLGVVFVVPAAGDPAVPLETRTLSLPPGAQADALATSRGGPWAAAVVRYENSGRRGLMVWDVRNAQTIELPLIDGESVNQAAFAGDRLFVGYSSGMLQQLSIRDGAWATENTVDVGSAIYGIGAVADSDSLYVLSGTHDSATSTVTRLLKEDLSVAAERSLEGGVGIGGPTIAVVETGFLAVGHGDGRVTFLEQRTLNDRGQFRDGELNYVGDLAAVPGYNQVVVSGRTSSAVVNPSTSAQFAPSVWSRAGPISSADADADGRLLATLSVTRGQIGIWMLQGDLRARVCSAIGRDLTPQEWREFVGGGVEYEPVCN